MAQPRPKLGDILTRLHLVDDDQVRAALDHQAQSGRMFGESLLDLGYIGEDDLSWALSTQLGYPFIAVTEGMADPALLAHFPADFLRKKLVLPLVSTDSGLSVVLGDPTDKPTLARLERMSGRPLIVAVGTPTAIRAALDSVFGTLAEENAPGAATPPRAGKTPPGSLSTPELAQLLDRALSHGASVVHLDPEGDSVKVRFRNADGALMDGGGFDPDTLADMVKGLNNWLGAGTESAPGIASWGNPSGDAEALLPFRIVAMATDKGTSLTLILDGMAPAPSKPASPFEEDWARIDLILKRGTGLVVAAAPTAHGRAHLYGRLIPRLDAARRRVVCFGSPEVSLPKGAIRFGRDGTPDAVADLSRLSGIDALAGVFDDLGVLAPLAESASRDRLVLAVVPGNGSLGLMARMLEIGISPTLLAGSLHAVLAQQLLPSGEDSPARAIMETLFVDAPLRRALQDGGTLDAIRRAAAEQEFQEIAVRVRELDAVEPGVLRDLDRYRYLEDAA
jgi:hypothetical protein